jgi:hypothetical protein
MTRYWGPATPPDAFRDTRSRERIYSQALSVSLADEERMIAMSYHGANKVVPTLVSSSRRSRSSIIILLVLVSLDASAPVVLSCRLFYTVPNYRKAVELSIVRAIGYTAVSISLSRV